MSVPAPEHSQIHFGSIQKEFYRHEAPADISIRKVAVGTEPRHTIIALDDDLIGDLCLASARALALAGAVPAIEIIAIGFGETNFAELNVRRAAKLTFEKGRLDALGWIDTGNARSFAAFLDEAVMPMCAATSSSRTLLGYSLSGAFCLQAAKYLAGELNGVAAISPSIWAEPASPDGIVTLYRTMPDLRVFLCAGALEEDAALTGLPSHMWEMVRALGSELAAIDKERVWTEIYDGETHFTVPFRSICATLTRICTGTNLA